MNDECDIVRDLLPLYAEGIASEGTREMIDLHCESCEQCSEERTKAAEKVFEARSSVIEQNKIWKELAAKQKRKKIGIIILAVTASIIMDLLPFLVGIVFIGLNGENNIPYGNYYSVEESMEAFEQNITEKNVFWNRLNSWRIWPPFRIIKELEVGDTVFVLYTCKYYPDDTEEHFEIVSFKKAPDGTYLMDYSQEIEIPDDPNNPYNTEHVTKFVTAEGGANLAELYLLPYGIDDSEYMALSGQESVKTEINDKLGHYYLCYVLSPV